MTSVVQNSNSDVFQLNCVCATLHSKSLGKSHQQSIVLNKARFILHTYLPSKRKVPPPTDAGCIGGRDSVRRCGSEWTGEAASASWNQQRGHRRPRGRAGRCGKEGRRQPWRQGNRALKWNRIHWVGLVRRRWRGEKLDVLRLNRCTKSSG
jgi:hypothetical protein